jgi:N utilization substance protein A
MEVRAGIKGVQIMLSRAHPGFLIKLFETEVPEISEGIVEIKGAAREPGFRAKIAVFSKDPQVDPVGACVGQKGIRVQSVVRELTGEKIDIVRWSDDLSQFITHALAPAQLLKIIFDEKKEQAKIIVADDQLSLAIGKKGQNQRLASRLTAIKPDLCPASPPKKPGGKAGATEEEEDILSFDSGGEN